MALLQVEEKEESDSQTGDKFSWNLKNNLHGSQTKSKHTPNIDGDPLHRNTAHTLLQ